MNQILQVGAVFSQRTGGVAGDNGQSQDNQREDDESSSSDYEISQKHDCLKTPAEKAKE